MARSWDEVATRLVVERGDALSRYAYLLTGSVDDAADLVQDALVRTFGTPRFGLTLPRAEAYVRRAILNQVIDRSRRDGTWRRRPTSPSRPQPSTRRRPRATNGSTCSAGARAAPEAGRVHRAAALDDLTVDGIARVLGISSGAVKRYLSDGLRTLSSSIHPAGTRSARRGGENVST